ncbi:hypothetical protein LY76DRAFT_179103 [Colletotrichum caudatum]|nr:hypothetical protein LY76DRAFT_179103 [Colletotrichum caudatum]
MSFVGSYAKLCSNAAFLLGVTVQRQHQPRYTRGGMGLIGGVCVVYLSSEIRSARNRRMIRVFILFFTYVSQFLLFEKAPPPNLPFPAPYHRLSGNWKPSHDI